MAAAPPERSPYQPPALLPDEERRLAVAGGSRAVGPVPLWVSALFAVAAVFFSATVIIELVAVGSGPVVTMLLFGPLLLLALFVLLCLHWPDWQPLIARRSLLWKLGVTVLAPLVSLLVFVPTLVAAMLPGFMFVGFSGPLSVRFAVLLLLPVGLAYFLTAVAISRWLWWWLVQQSPVR